MKKVNYHLHTSFSPDARVAMEDMVLAAIKANISEIAFTDHLDFDVIGKGLFDFEGYEKEVERVKEKYRASIRIIKGLELGIAADQVEVAKRVMKHHPMDFVILSLHTCQDQDLFSGEFFRGKEPHKAYRDYLEELYYVLTHYQDYDVVGHIDFISRYDEGVKAIDPRDMFADYDPILKHLIKHEKGLDLNSSGLRYEGPHRFYPSTTLLRRYQELGGVLVSLGSDGHTTSTVDSGLEKGLQLIREHKLSLIRK